MISQVSRRYAKALYELSVSKNTTTKIFDQIRVLKAAFQLEPEITSFIVNPLVSPDNKLKALKAALDGKIDGDLMSFLSLLAEKNRLGSFMEITEAFEEISDEANGVTRGTVRSATALSAESRKQIEDTVKKVTKRNVILTFKEDSSLYGGTIAQVGGWTFDDSLASHLRRMNEDLNRRTN